MGKLVRDNIPKIIQDDGRIVSWRKLEKTELFEALRDKLLEEALEVKQASENTVVLEICDVLEVVDALLDFLNLSVHDVLIMKEEKARERGKFNSGIWIDLEPK